MTSQISISFVFLRLFLYIFPENNHPQSTGSKTATILSVFIDFLTFPHCIANASYGYEAWESISPHFNFAIYIISWQKVFKLFKKNKQNISWDVGLIIFFFFFQFINQTMYKSFDKLVCTGTTTITYIQRHNTRYVKIYKDEFTVMIYM